MASDTPFDYGSSQPLIGQTELMQPASVAFALDDLHSQLTGVDGPASAVSRTFDNFRPDPLEFRLSSDNTLVAQITGVSLTIVRVNETRANFYTVQFTKSAPSFKVNITPILTVNLLNAQGGIVHSDSNSFSDGGFTELSINCGTRSVSYQPALTEDIFDIVFGFSFSFTPSNWHKC
jgi:hypothetical protein